MALAELSSQLMNVDSFFPFILAHFLLGTGLLYTRPGSITRPILVGLITVCCLIAVRSTLVQSIPGAIGAEYVIGFIFHASYFLCIVKLVPPVSRNTSYGQVSWACTIFLSARWGMDPSKLPSFSKGDRKKIPSRGRFVMERSWDTCWTVLIIYLFQKHGLNIFHDDFLFTPAGFLHRLSRVTPREMAIRIYMTLAGTVVPYCTLRAFHSLVSCLAVLGGDFPSSWPPLFGSIEDAYTVRRYFAFFWHHLMRKAFTAHASFIIMNVLNLPRKSPVSRYLIVIVTFFISAFLHIASSGSFSYHCSMLPQLQYYSTLVGAIILEDIIIRTYNLRTKKDSKMRDSNASFWHLVGYSWYAFFDVWSTSKLVYQTISCTAWLSVGSWIGVTKLPLSQNSSSRILDNIEDQH